MYGINLSWKMLQHYLSNLQKLDLLAIQDETKKFVTTKRGKEFVRKWKEIQELL